MIRINLLADRHAKERLLIQQQVVMGALIILGAILLCGFWWSAKAGQISDTNGKIEQAKKELDTQKKIREEVSRMEEQEKRLSAIMRAIEMLMDFKRGPVVYLDNLNVALPTEIWLTNIADTRGAVTIQGYSFSNTAVARLMKSLSETGQFFNVDLKEITQATIGNETLMKFTVSGLTSMGVRIAEEDKKRAEAEAASKAKKAGAPAAKKEGKE
ncbi:MAG: PilN domain-containing protein [Nitrospinae bacterium]|nr:PilN domain-containing protein [Nitrospinota bacterium]